MEKVWISGGENGLTISLPACDGRAEDILRRHGPRLCRTSCVHNRGFPRLGRLILNHEKCLKSEENDPLLSENWLLAWLKTFPV